MRIFFSSLICFLYIANINATNIKSALSQLTTRPYVDFYLKLTDDDKNLLQQIKVEPIEHYDNFGCLDEISVDLTLFFQSMGNDYALSNKTACLIAKLVKNIVKELGSESFWLTIRPQTKVPTYDVPRWHQDGYYYHPFKPTSKVLFTLKGTTTLFCNLSKKEIESFREIYYKSKDDDLKLYYGETLEGRQALAKLIDVSKVHQAESGMGTVLIAGGEEATIYSEPPVSSEIIFVSIVPGTKEQISEWRKQNAQ